MSYENPLRITYSRVTAVTDEIWAISAPRGATKVRLADISASVTTTYNAVTTPAKLGVGVASNTDKLGYISFGTTAADAELGWDNQYIKGTNPVYGTLDLTGASNTITGTPDIPEVLGPILISFTANTGEASAGAAVVDVTLEWF
jgi:hypothetical protein